MSMKRLNVLMAVNVDNRYTYKTDIWSDISKTENFDPPGGGRGDILICFVIDRWRFTVTDGYDETVRKSKFLIKTDQHFSR